LLIRKVIVAQRKVNPASPSPSPPFNNNSCASASKTGYGNCLKNKANVLLHLQHKPAHIGHFNTSFPFPYKIINNNNNNNNIMTAQQSTERRVSFSETDQIKIFNTVESEEKSSVWYTKKDLAAIRWQCSCTVVDDETKALDNACEEASLPVISATYRRRQKEFVIALLQQQNEQKQLGMQDPKGLFQFSRACSKKARQQALQKAREHEKEVQKLHQSTPTLDAIVGDCLKLLLDGLDGFRGEHKHVLNEIDHR
jgi:hypothetical protein